MGYNIIDLLIYEKEKREKAVAEERPCVYAELVIVEKKPEVSNEVAFNF